jgi:hypothetical protein
MRGAERHGEGHEDDGGAAVPRFREPGAEPGSAIRRRGHGQQAHEHESAPDVPWHVGLAGDGPQRAVGRVGGKGEPGRLVRVEAPSRLRLVLVIAELRDGLVDRKRLPLRHRHDRLESGELVRVGPGGEDPGEVHAENAEDDDDRSLRPAGVGLGHGSVPIVT